MRTESQEYNWILGLKGIGAFVIAFFWHYKDLPMSSTPPVQSYVPEFYSYGLLFVELFFALSGFGMDIGYLERIKGGMQFGDYIKKRLAKIYPLHFVTLMIVTAIGFCSMRVSVQYVPGFDMYHWFLNLFMIHVGVFEYYLSFNGATWYVSVVLLMYILFYYISKITPQKAHKYSFMALSVIGGALNMLGLTAPLVNQAVARGIQSFFVGCFLAEISKESKEWKQNEKKVVGIASALLVVFAFGLGKMNGFEKTWGNISMIVPVAIVPLTITACVFNKLFRVIFSSQVLVVLGKLSLPVYFCHHCIYFAALVINDCFSFNIDFSKVSVWITVIILTVVISKMVNIFTDKLWNKVYLFLKAE